VILRCRFLGNRNPDKKVICEIAFLRGGAKALGRKNAGLVREAVRLLNKSIELVLQSGWLPDNSIIAEQETEAT